MNYLSRIDYYEFVIVHCYFKTYSGSPRCVGHEVRTSALADRRDSFTYRTTLLSLLVGSISYHMTV